MSDNNIFENKILVLDGAMGTMIQRYGLEEIDFHDNGVKKDYPETNADTADALEFLRQSSRELKGNNECLNLTHPEIIEEIHREYIAAGADIIECNTFSANRISQKEYGTEALSYIMAREGAAIARRAADSAGGRRIHVAASIGPTSKSLSLAPDINHPDRKSVV